MTEKATNAKKAYYKKWRENNPDKIRQYQEKYWAKQAAKAKAAEEQEKEHK